MKQFIVMIIALFMSQSVWAIRSFDSIEIPDAYCGDGSPYKVFVEARSNTRLSFKIQGGGACWSHFTCFTLGTARGAIPERLEETQGFSSDNSLYSPVSDFSYVYFPYCTGDVHLGRHAASYKSKNYYHIGRENIERSIQFLMEGGYVDPAGLREFVLYGDSAGAIGALYHLKNIAPYFSHVEKKRVILDSPGLHFGDSFWSKFSDELFNDYKIGLYEVGMNLTKGSGVIAQAVPNVCAANPDWELGVIQSTRDSTMSFMFGEISPANHEKAVLGRGGILQLTSNPNDNCSAFIPASKSHVLMNKNSKLGTQAGSKTAIQYAYELVQEGAQENYN